MATVYILYNPLAGNGKGEELARSLGEKLSQNVQYYDVTKVTNYAALLGGIAKNDQLVIAGGDGTLNRFVNDTASLDLDREIFYYPMGTGNDFAHDLGMDTPEEPINVTRYLKDLPTVEIKGKTCHFINGIGFGIDGYCCQVGDEQKKIPGKKVNYTAIAVKGVLYAFAARNAKVTVDGESYTYKKVWIAPTMNGRFYGGGMMATPDQDRLSEDGKLSLMMFHGGSRLPTLMAFPGIFKGEHVKNKKMVAVHTGHEITVEFDRPTPLQIDGETVLDVTSYTVRSGKIAPVRSRKEAVCV